ncbi:MAG: glycosyltransferase [Lentisphaerae bacterium]|nr:glycosyltransferase [Lentisphaerota bacterium]
MNKTSTNQPAQPEKNTTRNRVLIFVPKLSLAGGIANYYRKIRDFLPGEYYLFEKSQAKTLPGKLLATVYDLLRFICLLYSGEFQAVCLNPSLKPLVVKREAVYAFIAKKLFRRKLIIFWHGWREDYADELEKTNLQWFKKRYFCADKMLVLISQVRQKLADWGYDKSVTQVVTCFDESYRTLTIPERTAEPCRILFLARVEKDKGIMETLQAYAIARSQSQVPLQLCIAGDGGALAEAKEYVKKHQLQDVEFVGYVRGDDKLQEFMRADIFIQPSYSEGLPGAMLEAMACALPVVTSQVGGIPDFFEEEKMGFMLNTLDPACYAEKLVVLAGDPAGRSRIGQYNRQYALNRFSASQAAELQCREMREVVPEAVAANKDIPSDAWSCRRGFLIISLLLVALTAGAFAAMEYHNSQGLLSRDGYSYLLYTQLALEESWSAALERYPEMSDYPPGLVMMMYGIGKLGGDFELAGRISNLLGILLTGWGVLILSRRLYKDKFMALCCALMAVSMPKLYMEGCNILRDPIYWAIMLWSVVLLLEMVRCTAADRLRYWLCTLGMSLLCGMGCIVRKEGLFLALLLGLITCFGIKQKLWCRVVSVLILLLVAVCFILLPGVLGVPWNILNSLERGLRSS